MSPQLCCLWVWDERVTGSPSDLWDGFEGEHSLGFSCAGHGQVLPAAAPQAMPCSARVEAEESGSALPSLLPSVGSSGEKEAQAVQSSLFGLGCLIKNSSYSEAIQRLRDTHFLSVPNCLFLRILWELGKSESFILLPKL